MSRKARIEKAIADALSPIHLEVEDESHMHAVPAGAESHFKILVVAEAFDGQSLVARHRAVNRILADEFQDGLHALALHTWTPDQWFEKGGAAPESPPCQGGSKAV